MVHMLAEMVRMNIDMHMHVEHTVYCNSYNWYNIIRTIVCYLNGVDL